jgi:phosphoglucosamine mutase
VALDGDADRLQMVDQHGRLYNGDELLYLLAMDRLQSGLPVPGVVGTLMTNLGIELALRRAGVELVRAKVGDRYVLEALLERGWHLGGEGSGHLLVLDRHTTGDALVSALQVLQALRRQQRSLSQCLQDAELFPQKMINVRLQQSTPWQATAAVDEAVKRVQAELGEGGRVLIRASGTEPVVRVMVEARDAQQVDRCCQYLADVVAQR